MMHLDIVSSFKHVQKYHSSDHNLEKSWKIFQQLVLSEKFFISNEIEVDVSRRFGFVIHI